MSTPEPASNEGETAASAEPLGAAPPAPLLLRRRSGRTAALVIGVGIGGGLLGMGAFSAFSASGSFHAVLSALQGYGLALSPLFLFAILVGVSKTELWLDPEKKAFRMLTYRPWRRTPRVEEAPVSEYAGVRLDRMADDYGTGTMVSLITTGGEDVPVRLFGSDMEARPFAEKLAGAAGLWVRTTSKDDDEKKPA